MPQIKVKPKLPERSVRKALAKIAKELEGGDGFEILFVVQDHGEIPKRYSTPIDPDTEEGHEIQGLLGKPLGESFEYADLQGKEAFVLLDSKRASGGRMEAFISALLTPKMVEEATRLIIPASGAAEKKQAQ